MLKFFFNPRPWILILGAIPLKGFALEQATTGPIEENLVSAHAPYYITLIADQALKFSMAGYYKMQPQERKHLFGPFYLEYSLDQGWILNTKLKILINITRSIVFLQSIQDEGRWPPNIEDALLAQYNYKASKLEKLSIYLFFAWADINFIDYVLYGFIFNTAPQDAPIRLFAGQALVPSLYISTLGCSIAAQDLICVMGSGLWLLSQLSINYAMFGISF